ncbi:MAG: nitrile hydratase subunit alpha, partial [Gammaproteobacteria bacterium]|nr:nitrile hydratase subunit alpha [Gammaproteobacteria bacterium]
LVVCTLCSCYPWPLLGLPPQWYKSAPYRSRAVNEPRKVLEEIGTHHGKNVSIQECDSTYELRYLLLPQRPSNTEGLTETELRQLVTRNSMIGVETLKAFSGTNDK